MRTLFDLLPLGFVAEPQVYHPAPIEMDVSMLEEDGRAREVETARSDVATLAASAPSLTVLPFWSVGFLLSLSSLISVPLW